MGEIDFNSLLDHDKYGEVTNSKKTFLGIGQALKTGHSVIIGWTDGHGTHLDILFTLYPLQSGPLQGGMSSNTDLFVSVARHGMFGFELNGKWKAPGYVGKKLNLGDHNSTTAELSELINNICKELES